MCLPKQVLNINYKVALPTKKKEKLTKKDYIYITETEPDQLSKQLANTGQKNMLTTTTGTNKFRLWEIFSFFINDV